METVPIDQNISRNRSISNGASELPRHENKRPRLDTDTNNDSRIGSATTADSIMTEGSHGRTVSPDSFTGKVIVSATPPPTSQSDNAVPLVISPRSKMTINTRPLSAQSQVTTEDLSTKLSHPNEAVKQQPASSDAEIEVSNLAGNATEPISISSSPEDDATELRIEIGSPQDILDDEDAVQMLTMDPADEIWRRLPLMQDPLTTDIPRHLSELGKFLELRDTDQSGEITKAIADWFGEIPPFLDAMRPDELTYNVPQFRAAATLLESLTKRRLAFHPMVSLKDILAVIQGYSDMASRLLILESRNLQNSAQDRTVDRAPSTCGMICTRMILSLASGESTLSIFNVIRQCFRLQKEEFCSHIMQQLLGNDTIPILSSTIDILMAINTKLSPSSGFRRSIYEGMLFYRTTLHSLVAYGLNREIVSPTLRAGLRNSIPSQVGFLHDLLEQAIIKQHSWLNIENCQQLLESFVTIHHYACVIIPELRLFPFEKARISPPKFEIPQIEFAAEALKLAFQKQLIQDGRMELRVSGIESMSTTFVGYWSGSNQLSNPKSEVLVDFVIDFVRQNNIIEYLLSVQSHPQIITRSSNVIGFVCISQSWRHEDTDVAWSAVLQCEDYRSSAAIIDVLKANLEHQTIPELLYLMGHIRAVPFAKFGHRMLNLLVDLISILKTKAIHSPNSDTSVCPRIVDTCLSLLRESQTPEYICSEVAMAIRDQIPDLLAQHNLHELDETAKANIFHHIFTDMDQNNAEATGSILALNAFLSSSNPVEAPELIKSYNFPDALVRNMSTMASQVQANGKFHEVSTVQQSTKASLTSRFQCLQSLLISLPQALDSDQCQIIWTSILNANLPLEIRSNAWRTLAEANAKLSVSSSLLEFVSSQFMTNLADSHLDMAVFEFARSAVSFEMRIWPVDKDPDVPVHIPSIEKLWRVVLNAAESRVIDEAMKFLVRVHLELPGFLRRSKTVDDKMQNQLVERCIRTVMFSARDITEIEPNDTLMTESTRGLKVEHNIKCRGRVNRSLSVLRRFLESLKLRPTPKQTPVRKASPQLTDFEIKGEPRVLRIRIAGHSNMNDKVKEWTVGSENTGTEVWQYLTQLTGWSQVNLINAGSRLLLEGMVSNIDELKLGLDPLQVSKALHAVETTNTSATVVESASPVDSRIMHHFDDLFALLEADNVVAQAIYDFLTMFSSQDIVLEKVKAMTLSATDLLPVNKPYKLLYYAAALRSCIEEESYSSSPNGRFLTYSIHAVLITLDRTQTVDLEYRLRLTIYRASVETLQLALKATVDVEVSSLYIVDPEGFVHVMLEAWQHVKQDKSSRNAQLLHDLFDVVCEAAFHRNDVWSTLHRSDAFAQLLKWSLLFTDDVEQRKLFSNLICRLCGIIDGKLLKLDDRRAPKARFSTEAIDYCLLQLWDIINGLLNLSFELPSHCKEALFALVVLFKRIVKDISDDDLLALYGTWQNLLLSRFSPAKNISIDNEQAPAAVARLLTNCLSTMKSRNVTLPDTHHLVSQVYQQCLFPPLYGDMSTSSLSQQTVPLVDHDARSAIYELILCATTSPDVVKTLVSEIESSAVEEDAFTNVVNNDRKALRSEVGYSGLKNLSNTCYLNSLFSQLFMNIRFRQLILDMDIVDEEKQKLLRELAAVFANMQSSFEKFIDTSEAVDSILQYTGEAIDVTVQMDVDEFFNLLFDRLETQILDEGARKKFKSMYGGELVQQIKSKECDHVSERNEPFSAIQVEIRGKANLQEGLTAYVEGEVLQGDNKYSCTSCGRHVDAVKRACIKEMPDNLIFNLKRFDYDIMTGLRTKVNDEFAFPTRINMKPYTIEALSEPNQELATDIFELVGVIVHAGTAETGHYYSFVRERPSSRAEEDAWIHFNDAEVSQFDFSEMRDQAFGGLDKSFNTLPKFYNGYMLFYQRSASLTEYVQQFTHQNTSSSISQPPTVGLSQELDSGIAAENELILRRYVAQDPAHARFVRDIFQRHKFFHPQCSETHEEESKLLSVVLNYIQQVSSRWKELPDFEGTIKLLSQTVTSCSSCALHVCKWFATDVNVMASILKPALMATRKGFAGLLTVAMQLLFNTRKADSPPSTLPKETIDKTLELVINQVYENWNQLQRIPRGWDQLFGVLVSVAEMGTLEATFLVELHILEKVLEIVWVHIGPSAKNTPKGLRLEYQAYLNARDKHKTYNHRAALTLFALLLRAVVLDSSDKDRDSDLLYLTDTEAKLLELPGEGAFEWLRRLIHTGNAPDAAQLVVEQLCTYVNFQDRLHDTLSNGLESTLEYAAAARFAGPCLQFVMSSSSEELVLDLVRKTLAAIAHADGYCNAEYLEYVQALAALQNTVSGIDATTLRRLIARYAGSWAPPILLCNEDGTKDVRSEGKMLVNELLNDQLRGRDASEAHQDRNFMYTLRGLVKGCATYVNRTFEAVNADRTPSRLCYAHGHGQPMLSLLMDIRSYFDEEIYEGDEIIDKLRQVIDELEMLDVMAEEEQYPWNDSEPPSEIDLSEVSP